MTPQTRRLALVGGALSLSLASAGWMFFGARTSDAEPAAISAAPARTAPAAAVSGASPAAAPLEPAAAAAPTRTASRTRAARSDTTPSVVTVEREVFSYASDGRRDPFRALIATAAIRPLLSELRLVAVVYDARGIGSVAILRDLTTNAQHRVRPGQLLGRMRVAQIRQKHVVFTIEELGFSRQEVLGLQDSSATRMP
jgi:hypothetical protein